MESEVYSIAFEGLHRVGKGTQIELLESVLNEKGIPFVRLKGDGSNPVDQNSNLDSASIYWWSQMNSILSRMIVPLQKYNMNSNVLDQLYTYNGDLIDLYIPPNQSYEILYPDLIFLLQASPSLLPIDFRNKIIELNGHEDIQSIHLKICMYIRDLVGDSVF
jgi:hypothetical protein